MSGQQYRKRDQNGVVYFTIPSFENTGLVRHGFSSRLGGVSTGECASLNLGFKKKDDPENIRENFRIFCNVLGIPPSRMVFTDQVHKDAVAVVTESHAGMGFLRMSDLTEIDALVTDRPGVALVTFHADCVPLFFLDPVHRAIGLSHSGWRGTVAKIGRNTLDTMRDNFGTIPEDCLAGIGPSIGKCCFEVDPPVADQFFQAFPEREAELIEPKGNKCFVDLWAANRIQLEESGIPESNIATASLCTCCRRDLFFSHRGEKGHTGIMAAMLMLTEG